MIFDGNASGRPKKQQWHHFIDHTAFATAGIFPVAASTPSEWDHALRLINRSATARFCERDHGATAEQMGTISRGDVEKFALSRLSNSVGMTFDGRLLGTCTLRLGYLVEMLFDDCRSGICSTAKATFGLASDKLEVEELRFMCTHTPAEHAPCITLHGCRSDSGGTALLKRDAEIVRLTNAHVESRETAVPRRASENA
jgi:hypothetical protein